MLEKTFLIHALSPLHAGTGQAADIVDLPIARMRSSGIPILPGSSIKGALRSHFTETAEGESNKKIKAVFGPDTDNASEHAGALIVGDARLLALPVRSFKGTFAWVTSPLLLSLARRDIRDDTPEVPDFQRHSASVLHENINHIENHIFLEDLDIPLENKDNKALADWAKRLAPLVSPGKDIFTKRFILVDDETMTFLWETATQVDTRIRLDEKTRTVAKGALWVEESLPPETLLIGLMAAERSREPSLNMSPGDVLDFVLKREKVIQFGGKATVGRGRCRLVALED